MNVKTYSALVAFVVAAAACLRSGAGAVTASTVDADFVRTAAESHANEIALARLELERGRSDEARSFAKRMLEDHPPLVTALEVAAPSARNDTAPFAPDRLERERLDRSTGADFDQQYVLSQAASHLIALAAFETEAAEGTDARLRAYAIAGMPTIREHFAVALAAVRHIGGDSPLKGP